MIQAYFTQLKKTLDAYAAANFILDVGLTFETRPGNQGVLRGTIIFIDNSELHFKEYLDEAAQVIEKLAYSYHYHDAQKQLIFRYDNAQHKPPLLFEEHKHVTENDLIEAGAPTIETVMAEISMAKGWL